MRSLLAAGALLACLTACAAPAEGPSSPEVDSARALFDSYVQLEHAYDPAMAELYSDDAVIKNTRRYPTGQVREMELTGAQYKTLIRRVLPLAQRLGDRSTYSDVTFELNEEGSVSIKASRYSERKDYTSPLKITVAPDREGNWRIIEELSESQP